jgi:hypothetical protein
MAKKHHSTDQSSISNTPLPTINTSPSEKTTSLASDTRNGHSFDNIIDIQDNQRNFPVVFVGSIVKKMSESKQLILGEVKNTGNRTIDPVVITAIFYDSSNRTLGNDLTNPIPQRLEPQQTSPFDLLLPDFISANDIASIKYHISGSY